MPYTYLTHAYCPYCKSWIHKSLILDQQGRKRCPLCRTHRVRMKAKSKKGKGFVYSFDFYKLPDPKEVRVKFPEMYSKIPQKMVCKVR